MSHLCDTAEELKEEVDVHKGPNVSEKRVRTRAGLWDSLRRAGLHWWGGQEGGCVEQEF